MSILGTKLTFYSPDDPEAETGGCIYGIFFPEITSLNNCSHYCFLAKIISVKCMPIYELAFIRLLELTYL